MPKTPDCAMNETDREGATNADPVLDIGHYTGVNAMPVSGSITPKGDSANQFRETPGSTPWKAAVIRDLREGFGVEDIALRMDCGVQPVRDLVLQLRRHGLLPRLYGEARCNWKSVGTLAARLVAKAEGRG